MDERTEQQLIEMTSQFYRAHATDFDRTRQGEWASWSQLAEEIGLGDHPVRVLDVGCGNGRWLDFLQSNREVDVDYVGLDNNTELLSLASDRYQKAEFVNADVTGDWPGIIEGDFDLVVCFGVMHHVPGHDRRVKLLRQMVSALPANGLCVVSFWQPKALPNFTNKVIKPSAEQKLGENDFLLGWNGDESVARYCHHYEEDEITELVQGLEGAVLRRLIPGTNNDATNIYAVIAKIG